MRWLAFTILLHHLHERVRSEYYTILFATTIQINDSFLELNFQYKRYHQIGSAFRIARGLLSSFFSLFDGLDGSYREAYILFSVSLVGGAFYTPPLDGQAGVKGSHPLSQEYFSLDSFFELAKLFCKDTWTRPLLSFFREGAVPNR